ncbi:MAG: electron transfer flavoprotein subunit alpha [Flavobacteriaceae bacterium]|nr:electron transfer flavoprotein subunit alpha [Flavobacteriaceae bacterium]|tara:strand:+ start:12391 stop:13341 length:951 start_codon:yes stop_codon:yes gene_type:complete
MSVIVYIESEENKIKKASLEAVSYAKKISESLKKDLIAVSFNLTDFSILKNYGVDKLYNISDDKLKVFEVNIYSNNLSNLFNELEPEIIVITSSANSRYLGPILASKIDAAYISNVTSLPISYSPFSVKRSCFTNKAFNETSTKKSTVVLSLSSNSYGLHENKSNLILEEIKGIDSNSALKVDSLEKLTNKVTIADADIVVSGGRGLKGPENWHLIEGLAEVLGAATACSKPVSDMGWRPHSEHVGQTGKPVASNLYIAVGISGAIQHLAGVNSSKVKVVINNDPEAPFFRSADYGIVGDAFEVLPKLIEGLKAIK